MLTERALTTEARDQLAAIRVAVRDVAVRVRRCDSFPLLVGRSGHVSDAALGFDGLLIVCVVDLVSSGGFWIPWRGCEVVC